MVKVTRKVHVKNGRKYIRLNKKKIYFTTLGELERKLKKGTTIEMYSAP